MADHNGVMQTQWTGWLDRILPVEHHSGMDAVELRVLGVLSRMGEGSTRIDVNQQTSIAVADAGHLLFDPDGTIGSNAATVDGVDYLASAILGGKSMARWWVDNKTRLQALRELEQTEDSFLFERKDGVPGLAASDYRTNAASRVSHVTFTDEAPLAGEIPAFAEGLLPDHPLQDLANRIISRLPTYSTGTEQVLWSGTLNIPAGGLPFQVRYPGPDSSPGHLAVASWTDPVAGTDYIATTGITVSMETAGDVATITIGNTGGTRDFTLQVRGQPLVSAPPIFIVSEDAASIAAHGLYEYEFPAPWLSTVGDVTSHHGFILRVYGQPSERLTIRWPAHYDLQQATERDLGDRVTVKRRGAVNDYFIESVSHVVRQAYDEVSYTLSPADVFGQVIILDVGPALDAGILAT